MSATFPTSLHPNLEQISKTMQIQKKYSKLYIVLKKSEIYGHPFCDEDAYLKYMTEMTR
jgi:hypothetical protein